MAIEMNMWSKIQKEILDDSYYYRKVMKSIKKESRINKIKKLKNKLWN